MNNVLTLHKNGTFEGTGHLENLQRVTKLMQELDVSWNDLTIFMQPDCEYFPPRDVDKVF